MAYEYDLIVIGMGPAGMAGGNIGEVMGGEVVRNEEKILEGLLKNN